MIRYNNLLHEDVRRSNASWFTAARERTFRRRHAGAHERAARQRAIASWWAHALADSPDGQICSIFSLAASRTALLGAKKSRARKLEIHEAIQR